jgi:hypothetical protein
MARVWVSHFPPQPWYGNMVNAAKVEHHRNSFIENTHD